MKEREPLDCRRVNALGVYLKVYLLGKPGEIKHSVVPLLRINRYQMQSTGMNRKGNRYQLCTDFLIIKPYRSTLSGKEKNLKLTCKKVTFESHPGHCDGSGMRKYLGSVVPT